MRIDKLSLLALEAVLELYLNDDLEKLPPYGLWLISQRGRLKRGRQIGWLTWAPPVCRGVEARPIYHGRGIAARRDYSLVGISPAQQRIFRAGNRRLAQTGQSACSGPYYPGAGLA